MKYNPRSMTARPADVIEYGAFQHPPSALFRDFLAGSPLVAPFYPAAAGWDLDTLSGHGEGALRFSRPTAAVTDALVQQQLDRAAEGAADRARQLNEPGTLAVVTGQQAGLFGGPLFVVYKALAALRVAEALEERRGQKVVPIFWVASDDHDFAEVRSTTVLDEGGQIRTLRYSPRQEPHGKPASKILLDETITALVDELVSALPKGPHAEALAERLRACYRPGTSLSAAFARLLSSLFPDLVVLDPADPVLKQIALPVVSRELMEASPTTRLATEVGQRLLAAGYHQQVPVRDGFLNVFVVMEQERRAIAVQNGGIEVRGLGRKLSLEQAARLLESDPAAWSPGVLLRPLVQDLFLPTAAYVGGPAEVAYHAQIGPSYAHFGIPRPIVLPRPSVTLVEPSQARALEAEGLTLPDLQADPEGLLARWARAAHPEIEAAFTRTREALEKEMAVVESTLAALDPTLQAAAEGARGRALHQIETLQEKATRALKKRDATRAERLRRTRDALLPGGAFQERGLGMVQLLARQGEGVLTEIRERIDPWARGHQVIHL
jgi:bacillithiol synthase